MDNILILITLVLFFIGFIATAWFTPLKDKPKAKKAIYLSLLISLISFALHIYLYSGLF